jgi:hypothetical protein
MKYAVTPTGKGASLTVAQALGMAKAGDVLVFKGLFHESIKTSKDGLTLDFDAAKIDATGKQRALLLLDADGTKIKGGEFFGANGAGIAITRSDRVKVDDVFVHDNARNGLAWEEGDRFTLSNSTFADNAKIGSTSNVSIKHPIAMDNSTKYGIVVTGITSSGAGPGSGTDAAGLCIDDANTTQDPNLPAYGKRILVDDFDFYGNSGPGLLVVWSDHVTARDGYAHDNSPDRNAGQACWRDSDDGHMSYVTAEGKHSFVFQEHVEVSGTGNVAIGPMLGIVPDFGVHSNELNW